MNSNCEINPFKNQWAESLSYTSLKNCHSCGEEAKVHAIGMDREGLVTCSNTSCFMNILNLTTEQWNRRATI